MKVGFCYIPNMGIIYQKQKNEREYFACLKKITTFAG